MDRTAALENAIEKQGQTAHSDEMKPFCGISQTYRQLILTLQPKAILFDACVLKHDGHYRKQRRNVF